MVSVAPIDPLNYGIDYSTHIRFTTVIAKYIFFNDCVKFYSQGISNLYQLHRIKNASTLSFCGTSLITRFLYSLQI